jgi:hypothetical protein
MSKRGNKQRSGWAGQWDRHRWPMPATRGRRGNFLRQVLSAVAVAGLIGWTQAPFITSTWMLATASPEEIARIEQLVHYSGCSEARAAGVAPLHRGSPGYRGGMDGDGDGVACEPYR